MAKIRIGFSTHFEIENELAGIGTDNPTNTKQVLGNIKSSDAKVIGITTLTTFDGFTDTKLSLQGSLGAKQHTTSCEIVIEGTVNVSSGTTYTSGPENLTVTDNFTLPGISDDKPSAGTMRFNEHLSSLEFYTGVEWRAVNSRVDMGGKSAVGLELIGKTYPGTPGVNLTLIESINIPTKGNATEFGDMITAGQGSACSSETRGFALGAAYNDTIEYVAFSSKGNGADFGNLTDGRAISTSGSSSTRGLLAGGWTPGNTNIIDYWEMQTTGNAIDFGDLVRATNAHGSTNSPTRMLVVGGRTPSVYYNDIQSITIASKGNAVDVGNWAWDVIETNKGNISSGPRGICGGTGPNKGLITSIGAVDIASAGTSIVFGDLSSTRRNMAGTSSKTRGLWMGGMPATPADGALNMIEYVTIQTEGNATDFGDLGTKRRGAAGCSNAHGGLGGF